VEAFAALEHRVVVDRSAMVSASKLAKAPSIW